jgi:hypothetical protein
MSSAVVSGTVLAAESVLYIEIFLAAESVPVVETVLAVEGVEAYHNGTIAGHSVAVGSEHQIVHKIARLGHRNCP